MPGHFCECARQFICVYSASVNTEAPVGEISKRRETAQNKPSRGPDTLPMKAFSRQFFNDVDDDNCNNNNNNDVVILNIDFV